MGRAIASDRLRFEVDGDFACGKTLHHIAGEDDGKDEIAHAIAAKDGGEAFGDDRLDAKFGECPHGVFAAGPASEICTCKQQLRVAMLVLIDNKIGVLNARIGIKIPPRCEHTLS